ncbi:MAG: hypothetical protein Q7J25_02925 [Vicinamibacterales bacterium]|nr:hypothetical protein [Vicinamibacterales bacterium]
MTGRPYCAVYDFGLFPYALGDVLTWNVQTAIRCEELGREHVDAYVCVDERHPPNIFQRDLITADNCELFFNELFGAFGTHPKPGNVFLYRRRDEMLERLREAVRGDAANSEDLADYERALADYDHALALRGTGRSGKIGWPVLMIEYFTKSIHSHERINAYAAAHGRIPLLRPSMGCEPDVTGLLTKRFAGNRIVAIQMRLRRLDAGYGAEHTYWRDSDFLEWYAFLKDAGKTHPDVQFVVMGRLQEKPLEMLRLPNVISLRTLGLGLGHELSLLLRSDLFMGTSSGFAALVNFSEVPYFITKMNPVACRAFAIAQGSERLPFAGERQILVYEPETRDLLMQLLERGLQGVPPRSGTPSPPSEEAVDARSWQWEQSQWLQPGATTNRFFTDDCYSDKETAFLVWPRIKEASAAWCKGMKDQAWTVLHRVETSFPRMCERFPEFLRLRRKLAVERNERAILASCQANLRKLSVQRKGFAGIQAILMRRWRWSYRLRTRARKRLIDIWDRKHKIPGKLARILTDLAAGRTGT